MYRVLRHGGTCRPCERSDCRARRPRRARRARRPPPAPPPPTPARRHDDGVLRRRARDLQPRPEVRVHNVPALLPPRRRRDHVDVLVRPGRDATGSLPPRLAHAGVVPGGPQPPRHGAPERRPYLLSAGSASIAAATAAASLTRNGSSSTGGSSSSLTDSAAAAARSGPSPSSESYPSPPLLAGPAPFSPAAAPSVSRNACTSPDRHAEASCSLPLLADDPASPRSRARTASSRRM